MRTAYDKGISLLDNSIRKRTRPLLDFTNHIQLISKKRSDLQLLNLANTHDLKLLHHIGNGHPHQPPALLNLPNRKLIELLIQLIPYPIYTQRIPSHSRLLKESGKALFSENTLQTMLSGYPDMIDDHLKQPLNNVIYLDHFSDANSYITKQQIDDFFTQRHIEIELLKRALLVARKRLSTNEAKLYKSILKNKTIHQQHHDLKAELQKLRAKHTQRQSELQTNLNEANRSAGDNLANAEAEIAALKEQIEAKETSRLQLQQDKAILAKSLQTETSRNLEFVQQARSLDEHVRSLVLELKATQQAGKDAELQYNSAMAAVKQEQEQALKTIEGLRESHQQLEDTLQQVQADSKALQEKMKQSLAIEKQYAEEEQARFKSVIEGLNQQLEANRIKAERQLNEARQQARAGSQMLLERMNQALATEKQHARDEQTRLENAIEELNQQLRATRDEADRQLDEARRQTQADIRSLHEQMDQAMEQALEAEKRQASEERTRLESEIKTLNQQLEANRIKSDRQLDEAQRQAQTEIQSLSEQMEQALEAKKLQASEERTRLESEIKALNQQLETNRADSELQLDEAKRQAQSEIQSLREQMDRAMEQALEAQKQQATEERTHLESEIKALNQQLEATRTKSDRQLEEAQRQALTEIQSLREQMNQAMEQALEAEKQQASEERTRLESEIKSLNQQLEGNRADSQMLQEQLEAIRVEACTQQDKRIEQEALLEQERNTSNELRDLLNNTEKALIETEKRFTDAKRTYQETLSESRQELESYKDARLKLTESEAETQKARQNLSSLRDELEQKIANLHAQLEHQQKSSGEIIRRHEEKGTQLQQSLSELQERAKQADSTIRLLNKEKESQGGIKAQLEDKLAKLQIALQTKQAELIASVESERQEKESLRQQLELVNAQNNDPTALQRANEEIILLKRKIKGMREVHLNMESQLIVDGSDETRKLHEELSATQAKLKNAMKLANQSKDLLRENQIHESAINILSEDLDDLTEEKKSLLEERDKLIKELSEIKEHHSKLASESCQLH